MDPIPVVVMGVSGVGKTTVGTALAHALNRPFVDADDLHPSENRSKMRAGIPLDDGDRWPWLRAVGAELRRLREAGTAPVVACSALKAGYRETLREFSPDLAFVYLEAGSATVAERIETRSHQYMPAGLLNSQLAALELPVDEPNLLTVDAREPVGELVDHAAHWLRRLGCRHDADGAPERRPDTADAGTEERAQRC